LGLAAAAADDDDGDGGDDGEWCVMCWQGAPPVSLPPAGSGRSWKDGLPDNCYIGNYSFI